MRDRMKALALLLVILVVWVPSVLLSPQGWWLLIVTVFSRAYPPWRPYALRLWKSSDNGVNCILGGHEDHTISGRVGYAATQGSDTAKHLAACIDFLFYLAVGQFDHCKKSIEWDRV